MLIDTVTIENFRSIEKMTAQLGPITVLVGPNNSGKSAFLRAMYSVQSRPTQRDLRVGATGGFVQFKIRDVRKLRLRIGSGDPLPPSVSNPASLTSSIPVNGGGELSITWSGGE